MPELLSEAFEFEFMQRALLGAWLAVVATSAVGTWVVLRGMAFLSDALAHGIIPGIAIAIIVGFNPFLGAIVAAVLMVSIIGWTSQKTLVNEDTATGLLFVGMLALGVVIISQAQGYASQLTGLLFGDVLGISSDDILIQGAATVVVLLITAVLYRPFMALTFNATKAKTLGMHPGVAHIGMLVLLALAIVASFQTVGTLLVFGLLVGPPATALLLVRKVPAMMAVSVLFGSIAALCGLLVSFHYGTAGGATIAGLAVGQFFIVLSVKSLVGLIAGRSVEFR